MVTCRPTGTIGGFGTIGGHTALYGTMQPGSDAVDTLRINAANAIVVYDTDNKGIYSEATGMKIAARESGSAANLLLYNGANIEFEIIDKDKHDVVAVEKRNPRLQRYRSRNQMLRSTSNLLRATNGR